MIGSKKLKMLYEIQSAMDRHKREDIRCSCTIGFEGDTSASIYIAKGSNSVYWFLFNLEDMKSSDLNIIKDRFKADLDRVDKGTAINEIKMELPVDKKGDVNIYAFLQRFKEENQNEK